MSTARPSTDAFEREPVALTERITSDGSSQWPVEPGRYRLVVARACPWANRSVIVRRLLGLEPVLSMGIAGPLHDERSWRFHNDPDNRDPVLGIEYLREAYEEMPVLWAYARDLFQTSGFGDTIDFEQIKQRYYGVHAEINPTGIVPLGPDPRGWLTAHGREELGGRPFGDGTPPGPPPEGERVPSIG